MQSTSQYFTVLKKNTPWGQYLEFMIQCLQWWCWFIPHPSPPEDHLVGPETCGGSRQLKWERKDEWNNLVNQRLENRIWIAEENSNWNEMMKEKSKGQLKTPVERLTNKMDHIENKSSLLSKIIDYIFSTKKCTQSLLILWNLAEEMLLLVWKQLNFSMYSCMCWTW